MDTYRMKRLWILCVVLCWFSAPAYAQREGKVAVGVSATSVRPADEDVRPTVGVGLTVGRVPKAGWGITAALNWFESDLEGDFAGIDGTIGTLRVRPLMGGVSYTLMSGRLATSFSVVGGPAFNRMRLSDAVRDRIGVVADDVDDEAGKISVAVRPGVNVSYAIKPRIAVTGFGGYLFNRPEFTFRTAAGEIRNGWKADALVLSAGVSLSLF
jgi:outer membrane protein W